MIEDDVADSGALSEVNVSTELCRAPMFGTPVSHAKFITLLGQGMPMSSLLWSEEEWDQCAMLQLRSLPAPGGRHLPCVPAGVQGRV